MSTTDQMDIDERYKYLRIMQKRYKQVEKRKDKQKLLVEMERVTGLHRKHLIPFPYRKLHPDNGSEFLNANLLRFLEKHYPDLQPTRSVPGKPNDNRFVEQKNSSLVRAYIGDIRLDTVDQTNAHVNIYHQLWLFNNCFQPSLHLISKELIPAGDQHPARLRRHHIAAVPWQRICDAGVLEPEIQDMLLLRIKPTNPRVLRRQIDADLDALYLLPPKSSTDPENVYETVAQTHSSTKEAWSLS